MTNELRRLFVLHAEAMKLHAGLTVIEARVLERRWGKGRDIRLGRCRRLIDRAYRRCLRRWRAIEHWRDADRAHSMALGEARS